MYVFFFKQKTAYEMRISDWSSDVCSSDLDASLSLNPFAASRSHILLLERSAAFPSKDCQSPSSGRSRASRSAGRCGRSGPSCAIARVMTATRVFQSGWVRLLKILEPCRGPWARPEAAAIRGDKFKAGKGG